MGDRKENIKRTLQITDYPWSSDDEDHVTQPMSVIQQIMQSQSQTDESRQNIADRPDTGTLSAGPSSSQIAARRNQARAERDLFWSYLANPRITSSRSSRSEVNSPSWTRQSDLRRILAFKKLNRPAMQTSRSATSLFAIQRAAIANANRMGGLGQYSSPSGSSMPSEVTAAVHRPGSGRPDHAFGEQQTQTSAVQYNPLLDYHATDNNNEQHEDSAQGQVSAEQSDDDVEMTGVSAPPHELQNEEQHEDEGSHEAPEISLEEEIVEIEGPGTTEGEAGAGEEGEREQEAHDDEQGHDAHDAPAEEVQELALPNVPEERPEQHGVKRKRNSNYFRNIRRTSVESEPATVKEFNQSLLRVLECPVCLEWMEPPMSQCRRGHLICGRCRARIAACPVCRCAFSSVRNRAMEAVADMLRYPCRHGCGREVRLRRRSSHEASCPARRYRCVAPACAAAAPLPRDQLPIHVQNQHMSMLKIGPRHRLSLKLNNELHENWLVMALRELFHLRLDVDVRNWGINVYVAYIGPKRHSSAFTYEVTLAGQYDCRKIVYTRATHCDLESTSSNLIRHDCFQLSIDQALNFLRTGNKQGDPDQLLHIDIEISRSIAPDRHDSDS